MLSYNIAIKQKVQENIQTQAAIVRTRTANYTNHIKCKKKAQKTEIKKLENAT